MADSGEHGFAGILDHFELVFFLKVHDGVHVTGVATQVHGHDGDGPGGDLGLDQTGVNVVVVGFDVDQNRGKVILENGVDGGDESNGGGQELGARLPAILDLHGVEANLQG